MALRDDDAAPCTACDGLGEVYSVKGYDDSNWVECESCDGYAIETDKHSRRAYLALCAESRRVGWPESYREDLTYHDRRFLLDVAHAEADPSEPFAWILRDWGTHMVRVCVEPIDGAGTLGWRFIERAFTDGKRQRYYAWDGSRLRALPDGKALASWVYETAHARARQEKHAA